MQLVETTLESTSTATSVPVMGCHAASRLPEKHVFFGDAISIMKKLPAAKIGSGRRLFYAIIEGDGQHRIYEYEQQTGNTYAIRIAHVDANTANAFDSQAERTMLENQGRACVGMAVQNSPAYKLLHLTFVGEEELDPATSYSQLLDSGDETFWKLSFLALC